MTRRSAISIAVALACLVAAAIASRKLASGDEAADVAMVAYFETEAVPVGTGVAGIVKSVHVTPGQQVAKGQVLVQLDDARWQTQLRRARELAKFAEATSYLAELSQRQGRQRAAENRYVQSLAEFEKSGTPASKAALEAAARNREQVLQDSSPPASVAGLVEMELSNLQTLVDACRIVSPVDGQVEIVSVAPGQEVAARTAIALIAHIGEPQVRILVDARHASRWRPGAAVAIQREGEAAARGTILSMDTEGSAATNNLTAGFVKLDAPPTPWTAGDRVRVRLAAH